MKISACKAACWWQALALTLGMTPAGSAQAAQNLGTFHNWSAQSFKVQGKLVCSMWSQPKSAAGKYTRRGDIFVWVTHRPKDKTRNRLSFEMGYPIKPGTQLNVRIDDTNYALPAQNSTAWSTDKNIDKRMVAAMRAGNEMEVKGVSKRGTNTRDVYSLKGFTAAHKAINKACGV